MTTATTSLPPSAAAARAAFWRIALLLGGMNAFGGLMSAFSAEKLSFLYKDQLLLTPSAFATLGVLVGLPNYLRPVLGSLSDLVPLWGYHRRSYFALATLLSSAAFLAFAVLPLYTYMPVLMLVILAGFGFTLRLVVAEAISVRVGNVTGQVQRLQTIQLLVPALLSIAVGAHLSGYVTQHWSYHACFLAAAVSSLVSLPLTLLIDERPLSRSLAPGEAFAEELRSKQADKAASQEALRQGLRSRALWVILAFVLYLQLTPSTGTAQFFYSVDALHFSKQLLGNLNAYSNGGALLGYIAFGALSPRLSLRAILWGGVIFAVVPMYAPAFFLRSPASAEIVSVIVGGANGIFTLSLMTLAARACPPRIEAIVFGAVMAMYFLGGALGDRLGSGIYTYFGAGNHLTRGWDALIWIGMVSALLSAAFIPFLPAWARSGKTLAAMAEEEAAKANAPIVSPA